MVARITLLQLSFWWFDHGWIFTIPPPFVATNDTSSCVIPPTPSTHASPTPPVFSRPSGQLIAGGAALSYFGHLYRILSLFLPPSSLSLLLGSSYSLLFYADVRAHSILCWRRRHCVRFGKYPKSVKLTNPPVFSCLERTLMGCHNPL